MRESQMRLFDKARGRIAIQPLHLPLRVTQCIRDTRERRYSELRMIRVEVRYIGNPGSWLESPEIAMAIGAHSLIALYESSGL